MDVDSLRLAAFVTVAALALQGFLGVSAFAVSELTRGRYQHLLEEAPERAKPIGDFVDRQAHYRLAFGAARTIMVAVATSSGTLVARALDEAGALAFGVALVSVLLIVSHVLPRSIVRGRPEEVARSLAVPIRVTGLLLSPIASLLGRAASLRVGAGSRERESDEASRLEPEELRDIIGERKVEEGERDMIDSIFDLEETTVHEVMAPRMDVVALPVDATVRQAVDVVMARGFSRLPVFEETIDTVVGILYAKDLFPLVLAGCLDESVRAHLRPPYFIPESKKVDDLLSELQKRRVHIAIVVDEYGGTAGLVTIEDLLEEIVGEIQDEFDVEEEKIVTGQEGEATFDATVSIDDVNHTLDLDLQGEDVETIGGLVYERLGKMPVAGDEVTVDGARIAVVSTAGRRIRRVKVTRVDDGDDTEAE